MIIKYTDTEKIHIHFGGCGGSYSYLLGVASYLQANFDLSNVVFSGISGGNIMCLLCILNLDIEEVFNTINIPFLCKLQNYKLKSFYNFIPEFKKVLTTILDTDKDNYLKVCDRLHISITHMPSFRNEMIFKFKSNKDLIDCILASSHIPFYNNTIFYKFRNNYYVDGYLSSNDSFNNDYFSKNFITLKFNIGTFRVLENWFIFISTCDKLAINLYNHGLSDMNMNLHKIWECGQTMKLSMLWLGVIILLNQ